MPIMVGQKKTKVFKFLKEKLSKRVSTWQEKNLSCASMEVLLKTVAHALPTYIMSLYLLTNETYYELQKMMNGFW